MTHSKHAFKIRTDHIRAHLEWLSKHNVGTRRVAELSGVGRTTITKILSNDPSYHLDFVTVETAERLLSVRDFDLAPSQLIDGAETTRRIAELRQHGYKLAEIAREIDVPGLRVQYKMVTVKTANRVEEFHTQVLNKAA